MLGFGRLGGGLGASVLVDSALFLVDWVGDWVVDSTGLKQVLRELNLA